jgi:hypothetical protein
LDEHEAPDQFYRHEDRREIVGSLMNLQRKIVQLGIKKTPDGIAWNVSNFCTSSYETKVAKRIK